MDDFGFPYCGTREIGGGTGPPLSGDWRLVVGLPPTLFSGDITREKWTTLHDHIMCFILLKIESKSPRNGTKWPDGIAANYLNPVSRHVMYLSNFSAVLGGAP